VVNRKLQARHTRRRRMTEESSVGRESFTWVSRLPQLGQRMALSYPGAARVTVLCCRRAAQFRTTGTPSPVVDRKAADELLHLLAHHGFDERLLLHAFLRKNVEHLDDQLAHLLELGNAEAAGRARGRAQANARGHCRLLRVERDAVLVAGDMGATERGLRHL